jgi:hypothetical protein
MQGNLDLGVTSVGITLGTTGTDVSVSGSPITSSGNITINIPTASATNRGALSAADWTTFNSKQGAITLTTTGTSGVSTLVGNTLNIPNYTTDLSGYVTLGTAQTITAQKTFSTSGNSDTAIINHGSGSGIALNISKAGNGEGLRVAKTSGSGNAMTVIGGNFEAPTIVKTGGTSSQFLKADGSVDSSTYLTSASASSTFVTLATAQTITGLKTFSTSSVEMAIFNSTFATGGVLAFSRNGTSVGTIGNSGSMTVGVLDDLEIRSGSAKKIHLRTDAVQFTLSPSGEATLFSANSSTPLLILNTTGTNQPSGIGTQQNGANKWAFGTNFGSADDSWNVYNYTAASRFLTIASTGAATFSNVVGINRTPTSGYKLDIQGNEGIRIIDNDVLRSIIITPPNSGASGTISTASGQGISFQATNASGNLTFETAGVERIRVTNNGLTFNGDTAAANALDDYEEGTWTMGIAFGGNSVGVTYGNNSGRYTKVGRQVTIIGYMSLTSKGSSTGLVAITGLPFTIGSTNSNYSAPALYMSRVSFSGQFHSYGDISGATIAIRQVSEAGVPSGITNNNCGNDSDFIVSFTYFV